jgi:nicotinic acid phosphoribosyltransferase
VSIPSDVAVSGTSRSRLSPISSSNARAAVSPFVDGVEVEDDVDVEAAGSRAHALMSGTVVLYASAAMASRRVNKESDNTVSGFVGLTVVCGRPLL